MRFLHTELLFPAFSATYSSWPGASYAITTLAAAPGANYVFKLNIPAQSETFVSVIRWNSGATYYRYKLWDVDGAIVPFGLYGGEKVINSQSPTLEIWNVNGELTAAMSAPWTLPIGLLELPDSISDTTPSVIAV